jgi:hypothetical protein
MNINELQENIDNVRSNCEGRQNIIRQVKYLVELNRLYWINDRFAQISNNSFTAHVTAVHLVFDCKTLVEVNFSTKFKWKDHKKENQNLLNYLFVGSIKQFIIRDTRKKFKIFFIKYRNNFESQLIDDLENTFDNADDNAFLRCIYELLMALSENTIEAIKKEPLSINQLHHLIIIFFDYLILPDIFMREFKRSTNLQINQYCYTIRASDIKTHPDSKLAVAVHSRYTGIVDNRIYIGVSHLSCLFCSIFLDTHAIDFRVRSGQLEKWKIPDTIKEIDCPLVFIDGNKAFFTNLNNMYQIYKNDISMASPDKPFNFNYHPEKNEDDCQWASGFISDDTIKFFNYYKYLPNDCLDFNIVLEEFYCRDNIMKLIYKLREKILLTIVY